MKTFPLAILLLFPIALAAPAAPQNAKLHPPLSGGRDVHRYDMSPDGRRVVYLADQDVDGPLNLYSVGVRGGPLKRLDSRPCSQFVIAGDSRRIAYTRFPGHLSSVPIDGREPPIDIGPYSSAFQVTPDGRTVVFLVGSLNGDLYSVPIDGSSAPVLLDSENVHHVFRITPDGLRVVYLREGTIGHMASMGHVCSALLDGSEPPVVLNSSQSPASIGHFAFDPASEWLVFREGSAQTFSDGLFTVPLDGSAAPVLLNEPLGPQRLPFTEWSRPRFTPDGSRVVYMLDFGDYEGELYSAPIDGSTASIGLNAPLPADGGVVTFRVTLDGSRAVYLAQQETVGAYELYSVPMLGGAPVKLNAPLVPGGSVFTFKLSPDGNRLAYIADQDVVGELQVYLAPLEPGGPVVQLSDPVVSPTVGSNGFHSLEFVPDGSLLVYTGYDEGLQLYAVGVNAPPRPWRLDGPQVAGGSVRSSEPYPLLLGSDYNTRIGLGGTYAVYRADQDQDEVFELYTSPLFVHRAARR